MSLLSYIYAWDTGIFQGSNVGTLKSTPQMFAPVSVANSPSQLNAEHESGDAQLTLAGATCLLSELNRGTATGANVDIGVAGPKGSWQMHVVSPEEVTGALAVTTVFSSTET